MCYTRFHSQPALFLALSLSLRTQSSSSLAQLAGMINVVVANPLWLVATRMKQGQQSVAVEASKDGAAAAAAAEVEGGAAAADSPDEAAAGALGAGVSGAASSPPKMAEAMVGVLGLVRLMLHVRREEGVAAL